MQDIADEMGKYMGGQMWSLDAPVPDNNSMYCTHEEVTYNNKYAGSAWVYIPTSSVPRYAITLSVESVAIGSHFVGTEVELVTSTTFRLNYIAGTIQTTGAVTDRVAAGSGTWPFGHNYKIDWYTDRNGPNDTFWVNNIAYPIANMPTQNVTYIHTSQYVFVENTPAGFGICSLWTTVDPTIDYNVMNNLRLAYPQKAPVYLGSGRYMPNGTIRPLYIHSHTSQLINHADNQPFNAVAGGIIYSKKNVRFQIA